MFCRVKILTAIFIQLCALIAAGDPWVEKADNKNILTSYPRPLFEWITHLDAWKPNKNTNEACKLTISSKRMNASDCELTERLSWFDQLKSKLWIDFPEYSDADQFQKVIFHLQDNQVVRGSLGWHKGQKRPLVILRLGIHGNTDEVFAERYLAKIFFSELKYHVLILENLTSHGYLSLNQQFSFGGIEEGLQTYFILQMFRNQLIENSDLITDYHLAAVSLGGHGGFVTQYLDQNSLIKGQKSPMLKSTQLFCPVVQLDQSFQHLSNQGLFQIFVDYWNQIRMPKLVEKTKFSNWKSILSLQPQFFPNALEQNINQMKRPIFNLKNFDQFKIQLPHDFVNHIDQSKNYFDLNQIWSFYRNENQTYPISIYTTPNDPAVPNQTNVDVLKANQLLRQNINFVDLKGVHCALASEYQWPYLVELIKSGLNEPNSVYEKQSF